VRHDTCSRGYCRVMGCPLMRIPTKSAIDSDRSQPPVPTEASRAFPGSSQVGGAI
jgi:hypothetical protein